MMLQFWRKLFRSACTLNAGTASPALCYGLYATFIVTFMIVVVVTPDATTGQTVLAPQTTVPVPPGMKGYVTEVSSHWPPGKSGYRFARVRITDTNTTAPQLDRRFQVVVHVKPNYYQGNSFSTTVVPLTIRGGQLTGTADVYFPNYGFGGSATTELIVEKEGGSQRYENFDIHQNYLSGSSDDGYERLNILLVSSDVSSSEITSSIWSDNSTHSTFSSGAGYEEEAMPDFGSLRSIYGGGATTQTVFGGPWTGQMAIATPAAPVQQSDGNRGRDIAEVLGHSEVHAIPLNDLPEQWVGLTGVDIILLPLSDLANLRSENSPQLDLIQAWASAGGFLVVFDDESEYNGDGSSTVDTDSVFRKADAAGAAFTGIPAFPGDRDWSVPGQRAREFDQLYLSTGQDDWYYYDESLAPQLITRDRPALGRADWQIADSAALRDLGADSFLLYDHVEGTLCFVGDNMQGWTTDRWVQLLNTASLRNGTLTRKIGIATARGEPGSGMMIEGVGKPPIRIFQFLICVFLFAIGPFCYTLLRKQNRMQLLFVVVPAASLLVCLGLVVFAALSDGFQTRGRMRSFTSIDHSTNTAVTWTQHSYYRGIQPGRYEFDQQSPAFMTKAWASRRVLYDFTDENLRMSGGDARPRMPHQIFSLRTYASGERLELLNGDNGEPAVRNGFQSRLIAAWIKTPDGIFRVGELAPGETSACEPTIVEKARGEANRLVSGMSPDIVDDFYSLSDYRRPYYYYNGTTTSAETRNACAVRYDAIMNNYMTGLLEEGNSYVAVFEQLESESEPRSNIDYRNRIHVVNGKW